jgi:hypothetical protein
MLRISSNAFPIEPPSELLSFEPKSFGEHPWRELRAKTRGKNLVAAPERGHVLALGTTDDVKELFAGEMKGEIERVPIIAKDLARDSGAVISLLLSALVRAFAQKHGLQTDGEKALWSKDASHWLGAVKTRHASQTESPCKLATLDHAMGM